MAAMTHPERTSPVVTRSLHISASQASPSGGERNGGEGPATRGVPAAELSERRRVMVMSNRGARGAWLPGPPTDASTPFSFTAMGR